ncbi:MAG: hypothetical protein K8L97_30910 [Anaerolineae bacterium]|nr:hypothetical protein [Anaerolineae bacterium]
MSSILQVAIGMVFIYSLLSILVTQINTVILNILNLRAKQLKEGLVELVQDKELQAKILAHPLIRMVEARVTPSASLTPEQAEDIVNSEPTQVTYIEPSTFVEALISLFTADADNTIFKPLEEAISFLPNNDQKVKLREMIRDLRSFGDTDTNKLRAAILELPNENHKQVLSYSLEAVEDALGRLPIKAGQLVPLLEGIRKIKDEAFQDAIKTVLVTAQSLQDARTKLENWFNDGMNRVSEIYKRKIQLISLLVGLVLALLLNADSLQLLRAFWEDPALRQSVSETAKESIPALEEQINQSQGAQSQAEAGEGAVQQSAEEVSRSLQQLLDLQLPIGWEFTPITEELIATSQAAGLPDPRENSRNVWNFLPGNNSAWLRMMFQKIIGLVATMIAIAQGAPFWFDLLRRIAGGSSSGQQPSNITVTVNNPNSPPNDWSNVQG